MQRPPYLLVCSILACTSLVCKIDNWKLPLVLDPKKGYEHEQQKVE